ncbi:MAG: tRNA (N6-isopentenyl adenosine(37)-C2)-methylthiotransferase MiaB [Spirochaetes bacterium]|nr:tRNA (N6-isopentenyl adenosine(37)-C2)-methylthiotransferase MiaB [Spirochaetota bacterium]
MNEFNKNLNVYFEIYGCEMNKSQANSLINILKKNNINICEKIEDSDFIIIFTCSVRKSAEDRAFGRLSFFKKLKREGLNFKVIIAGCMSEEYREYFIEKKYADFIVGTKRQEIILDYILSSFSFDEKIYKNYKRDRDVNFISANEYDDFNFLNSGIDKEYQFLAYVSIVHGCSNYCSYCIVPYLRGKEVSRNSEDIINDVKKLAEQGVNYIILLGQNVLYYGKDNNDISFSELITKLHNIDGIEYISFLSPHPKDFDLGLIKTICELPKLTKVIHLPLQSGSDKILRLMNRKYTITQYMNIIENFYKFRNDINFTTDIIVGFPFESEDDFQETLNIVKNVRFIDAFTYKYSKRPIVKKLFDDNIPEEVKDKRLLYLVNLVQSISVEKRKENINKIKRAIILKESKYSNNYYLFKTFDGFNGVIEKSYLNPSNIVDVKLKNLKGKTFVGELLNVKNII